MHIEPFAEALRPNPHPIGRTLAVASGKGGVGKTFLSVSLAHAFARRGERVLLFDGDLGLANVDVQLGLSPVSDLAEVLAGRVELEAAVSPVEGGADEAGFDVLAGRSGSGALAGLSPRETTRICAGLTALSMSYDRVLLDLGAGVEPTTLRLAAAADDVLIVIQDEPTSLTDAYAFIKCLKREDETVGPRVVVNAVKDEAVARRAWATLAKTCESFLGAAPPLAGWVRRDAKVAEAIRAQSLIASRAPSAAVVADIDRLVETLAAG